MPAVTKDDVLFRIGRLQQVLVDREIDLAIINCNTDLYYYTGSVQPLYLLVPSSGKPLMLSRKALDRIHDEAGGLPLAAFTGSKDMATAITNAGFSDTRRLGLTLDATAYATVTRLQKFFPGSEIADISWDIRTLRMVKSPAEIAVFRRAGALLAQVPDVVRAHLHPGITEVELSAALEYFFRTHGGDTLIRCRREGVEMSAFGVVTAGRNSLAGTKFDGLNGGTGLGPAVPYGASADPLPRNMPVMIDVGLVMEGYHSDQSRVVIWGTPSADVTRAFEAMCRVQEAIFTALRPGATWEEPYAIACKIAADLGYADSFMGTGLEKVKFVGHGLGLELDDPPFIAAGMPDVLEENMVLAIEPKVALPDLGIVGIEDTVLLTASGIERLTVCPRELIVVQ